jgi:tRNA pseudouridine-54 N-methylase
MSLAISGTSIRQDSNGRFCLNDLHKAAGGENKHRPSLWVENQQTKSLISELESEAGIPALVSLKGGKVSGTFAAKELVYAYAMWISAKFHIAVIRAYDSLVSKPAYALRDLPPKMLTPAMKKHINQRVNYLVKHQVGASYASLGKLIQDAFNVNKRELILASKYPELCALLGCEPDPKALQGELLEPAKIATPEFNPTSPTFTLENITNQTVITQQHNGLTVSYIAEKGTLIGTVENIIRDLKVLGYHVVKNEKDALETISRIANSGFVA